MEPEQKKNSNKVVISATIFGVVLILIIFVIFSWILTRGVEDEETNVPTSSEMRNTTGDNAQQEPSNPNVTGGSSGTGTGTANDPAVPTPSPAGGVDTNQVPAPTTQQ